MPAIAARPDGATDAGPRTGTARRGGTKLSVAMATYNAGRYLREQLDSILAQTLAPDEIVISDDGSTDATLAVLAEYAERHQQITVLRNETQGPNRINCNFENALRRCSGDWVLFSDQDDIWLPNKVEILSASAGHAPLVYGRSALVGETGQSMDVTAEKFMGFRNYFSGWTAPYLLINANTVPGHAMMVDMKIVGASLPFPSTINYDQWLALVSACMGPIRFVEQTVVLHRIHTGNSVHFARPVDKGMRSNPNTRRPRASAAEKYVEGVQRKAEILYRMRAFSATLPTVDRDFLPRYVRHVESSRGRFFDLRFFLAGFPMRKRLYPRKFVWRLFKECIGGRCYRLAPETPRETPPLSPADGTDGSMGGTDHGPQVPARGHGLHDGNDADRDSAKR